MSGTILFVDDESELRFLVTDYLEHFGYKTLEAANITEAINQTNTAKVDVIILDVNMPGGNTEQLLRHFKDKQPGVPVILYSGRSEDDDLVKELLIQGAHRYLPKDGSLSGLLRAVQEVL